jgi:hypothetical protein
MPATGTRNFADPPEYPFASKSPDAAFGRTRTLFSGATGLVGTTYGVPGIVATRRHTGTYRFLHPPSKDLTVVSANVQGPTGTYYHANVVEPQVGMSGYFDVNLYRMQNAPVGTGIPQGSAALIPQNPATGTVLVLSYFNVPKTTY